MDSDPFEIDLQVGLKGDHYVLNTQKHPDLIAQSEPDQPS